MMTMDEMMQEGRKRCQEMAKSIDQTTKMIDEAEQSNDPARMRDALGQTRKTLAEMKNHMDMCLNIAEEIARLSIQFNALQNRLAAIAIDQPEKPQKPLVNAERIGELLGCLESTIEGYF